MPFPCGAASGAEMKCFTFKEMITQACLSDSVCLNAWHASHMEGDIHHNSSGQNKDLEYSSYNIDKQLQDTTCLR